jgi:hypothetical protein
MARGTGGIARGSERINSDKLRAKECFRISRLLQFGSPLQLLQTPRDFLGIRAAGRRAQTAML